MGVVDLRRPGFHTVADRQERDQVRRIALVPHEEDHRIVGLRVRDDPRQLGRQPGIAR